MPLDVKILHEVGSIARLRDDVVVNIVSYNGGAPVINIQTRYPGNTGEKLWGKRPYINFDEADQIAAWILEAKEWIDAHE